MFNDLIRLRLVSHDQHCEAQYEPGNMFMLRKVGTQLAQHLSEPRDEPIPGPTRRGDLAVSLQVHYVLLVEGTSRISSAIEYLTQSSWSHAAIFLGDNINQSNRRGERLVLVEADLLEGVRVILMYLHTSRLSNHL